MLNLFVLLRGQVHRLTPTFIIEPTFYNDTVMSGKGCHRWLTVITYTTTYVSEDSPDMEDAGIVLPTGVDKRFFDRRGRAGTADRSCRISMVLWS